MTIRVLIVEDSPPMAMLLGDLIKFTGDEVAGIAEMEEEAVAAAETSRPDLLLPEVRLRQGSGLAALSRILARHDLPHVVMSGNLLDPGLFDRDSAVLRKPFTEDELIDPFSDERRVSALSGAPTPDNPALGEPSFLRHLGLPTDRSREADEQHAAVLSAADETPV